MDQNIALTPASAALLAACLGAALGWASLARKRPAAAVAHAGVAAAIAMSVDGATTLRVWALSRLGSDHAMSTVIVGVCLVGLTITLRGGSARVRAIAAGASLLFTALVALLAGSQEPALATGAALVAIVALAAPDPPVVALPRSRSGRMGVSVPQHSSPRLP